MIADFHFLRPWWLAALPLGGLLLWKWWRRAASRGSWSAVIDPGLQPYVLIGPHEGGREHVLTLVAGAVAWTLAVVALAGPAWDRAEVPVFRSSESLVVALDLSRSMDATDVAPTRLARAKLKLLDLLERRRGGQTGLVVFSAHAFTVTPLTSDWRTIGALLGSLSSDIMPSSGSRPEAGLERAAQLMRQTGIGRGEILLISDADVSPTSLDTARALQGEGYVVHVLAVGTEDGAPIDEANGGFLTDRNGQIVIPRLNVEGLRSLARAGGGRFAQLSPSDRDLETLFPSAQAPLLAGGRLEEGLQGDVWRDQGRWLALALLPFVALAFRRGWIAMWLIALILPAPPAAALEWADLWQRPDQRAYEALQEGDPERAAGLFRDRQWLAAARYRNGDYGASAEALAGIDTAEAHYNRGNALAKSGDLEAAIEAYRRALELQPDHEDARYNLNLLTEAQRQQASQQGTGGNADDAQPPSSQSPPQQPPSSESPSQSTTSDRSQSDAPQPQSAASAASEPPTPEDAQSGSEPPPAQAGAEPAGDASTADSSEPPGQASEQAREGQARAGDDGETAPPGASDSALSDEELREWASEQAAEQWLRRVPQDPGGLLRRKFLYQYRRLGIDQDGNYVWPGDEVEPW